MNALKRWWYLCLLASYRHDAIYLGEYIDKAKRDRRTALLSIELMEHELRKLDGDSNEAHQKNSPAS